MNNLYYKKKKLGRIVAIQFFNNRMMIAYVDRDGKLVGKANDPSLNYGRPHIRFYKVKRNFKSKLRYAKSKVQARFGKNRS